MRRLVPSVSAVICGITMLVAEASATPLIFVADGTESVIRQYTPAGTQIGEVANPELQFPTLLAADQANQRLITDINGVGPEGPDLISLDLDGNILARASTAEIFGQQGGGFVSVAVSGRNTYFVTSTQNTQIVELDLDLGVVRRFPSGAPVGGLRTLGATLSPDQSPGV